MNSQIKPALRRGSNCTGRKYRHRSIAARALVSLLATVLIGCAVTTVDVDVYKGPMVNDEIAQIEQTAAMAIGAKPLLIQLRDRLEWGRYPDYGRKDYGPAWSHAPNTAQSRMEARDSGWYRDDGFIPPYGSNEYSRFNSDLAAEVNGILYLYDDIGDTNLLALQRNIEHDYKSFLDSFHILEDIPASTAVWQDLQKREPSTQALSSWLIDGQGNTEAAKTPDWKVPASYEELGKKSSSNEQSPAAISGSDETNDSDLSNENSSAPASANKRAAPRPTPSAGGTTNKSTAPSAKATAHGTSTQTVVSVSEALQNFHHAYEEYLAPRQIKDNYRGKKIFLAYDELDRALRANNAHSGKYTLVGTPPGPLLDVEHEANAYFAQLQDRSIVRLHAILLFGTDRVAIEKFVDEVTAIADSFINARSALSELLLATLNAINYANQPQCTLRDLQKQEFTKAASQLAAYLIDQYMAQQAYSRSNSRQNTASPSSAKSSPSPANTSTSALSLPPPDDYYAVLQPQARPAGDSSAPPSMTSAPANAGENDSALRDPFPNQSAGIAIALQQKPVYWSQVFLDLHRTAISQAIRPYGGGSYLPLNTNERDRFGISRGPSPALGTQLSGTVGHDVQNWINSAAVAVSAGGLQGGRLPEGIETLVDSYLAAQAQHPLDSTAARQQLQELLVGLINFAQKVLFIANNEQLVSALDRPASAFNPAYDSDWNLQLPRSASPELRKQYLQLAEDDSDLSEARLLQAVGNSILVQVNEIIAHDRYDYQQEQDSDLEKQAVLSAQEALSSSSNTAEPSQDTPTTQQADDAGSPPPAGASHGGAAAGSKTAKKPQNTSAASNSSAPKPTTNPLLSNLWPTTAPSKAYTRQQIMDELLHKLTYERAQLTASQGENAQAVQNVDAAIKYLTAERANQMYVRTPSMYLRDSYPVTSLQQNASSLWTNQLALELTRGMPFYEYFRDNWFERDAYNKAQQQREIDKQFWQNINEVRVAGTGDTNYVIAKDDIGNWYVKGYSADPKSIIQSMTSLAMYATGSPVTVANTAQSVANATGQAAKQALTPKELSNPNIAAQQANQASNSAAAANNSDSTDTVATVQSQQLSTASSTYLTNAKSAAKAAADAAKQLQSAVQKAWGKNTDIPSAFSSKGGPLDKTASAVLTGDVVKEPDPKDTTTTADTYMTNALASLRAMRDFHYQLVQALYGTLDNTAATSTTTTSSTTSSSANTVTQKQVTEAINLEQTVVRSSLLEALQQGLTASNTYVAQLNIIASAQASSSSGSGSSSK